ncbi:MAG: hypothetical protein JNM74_07175, partial [Myxococcales bacterium]|nr:hypothetical protein [Myxococcales bacterium]
SSLLAACGGLVEPCPEGACAPSPSPTVTPTSTPTPTPPDTPTASPAPTPLPAPSASSDPDADPDCPGPYMGRAPDGRCVWSCSEGTQPAADESPVCVCQPGLREVGRDDFGRRICR